MKIRILGLITLLFCSVQVWGKDYKVDDFGAVPDGRTINTRSIQYAMDYISESGGGRLVFPLGRYLSGTIHMRSNVTIHLEDGAVLLGSTNPFDYDMYVYPRFRQTGFLLAYDVDNIGITGQGTIDGQGRQVAYNLVDYIHRGLVEDPLQLDRPNETRRPMTIYFRECRGVDVKGVRIINSASWVHTYDQCDRLHMDGVYVESNAYWNNDGLDVVDCTNTIIENSYFDAADDAICLKSHSADHMCKDILIRNCVGRSGASGIKFGTVSAGGFVNITMTNNKIYDTYRSAFTIGSVDGSIVDNILVDTLVAINTGNVIYLRTDKRWGPEDKMSVLKNVTIQNVYAEVPAGKPDAGYDYEGPIHHMPRNVSPASIVGQPDMLIENITMRNIEIVYPGGAKPYYAFRGTTPEQLESVPEMRKSYPEFSQFRELPAWGFYIRHARNITFENVTMTALTPDYRPALVTDDVVGLKLINTRLIEPGVPESEQTVFYKTSEVTIE